MPQMERAASGDGLESEKPINMNTLGTVKYTRGICIFAAGRSMDEAARKMRSLERLNVPRDIPRRYAEAR